jgi:acyl-coenzyme A thioesterase PaaI-like protein
VRRWIESMPIFATLGVEFVAASAGRAEMRLPFRPEIGFGVSELFPASVIGAFVDFCGGAAAGTLCEPGAVLATADFSLAMLGPGAGAALVAHARVPRPNVGGTFVSTVEVFVEGEGEPCAVGRVTMRARRRR